MATSDAKVAAAATAVPGSKQENGAPNLAQAASKPVKDDHNDSLSSFSDGEAEIKQCKYH